MSSLELIHKEFHSWKWLLDFPDAIERLDVYSEFFSYCNEMKDKTSNFQNDENIDNNERELIFNLFDKDNYIYSTSGKGRFVISIQDKEVAAECLIAFTKGVDKQTEGLINAFFYKKGLKSDILTEKNKYKELLADFKLKSKDWLLESERVTNLLSMELREGQQGVIELKAACKSLKTESEKQKKTVLDIEEIKNDLDGALKLELESKVEHASKSYNDSVKSLHEQLEVEKATSKQRFDGFVDAYKNQMRLKAPVQYWAENVEHHKKSARNFGIASIVLSMFIFLPIAYVAWEILATEEIVWGKVGVVAFTTSLAIWLIRILVRMYLSHNHMQMNSQERVVMTQAYLALISEGGASSDEERNLVLQAIFRPVSTGIITDDASPHNIIELINKSRK